MKTNKVLSLIAIGVIVPIFTITGLIPMYLHSLDNDLPIVEYVCITGFYPTDFAGWKSYDNDTHYIDMDDCRWIPYHERHIQRVTEMEHDIIGNGKYVEVEFDYEISSGSVDSMHYNLKNNSYDIRITTTKAGLFSVDIPTDQNALMFDECEPNIQKYFIFIGGNLTQYELIEISPNLENIKFNYSSNAHDIGIFLNCQPQTDT